MKYLQLTKFRKQVMLNLKKFWDKHSFIKKKETKSIRMLLPQMTLKALEIQENSITLPQDH